MKTAGRFLLFAPFAIGLALVLIGSFGTQLFGLDVTTFRLRQYGLDVAMVGVLILIAREIWRKS